MKTQFVKDLEALINRHSIENDSDTPDYLLAQYLADCLTVYARVVRARDKWFSFVPFAATKERTDGKD